MSAPYVCLSCRTKLLLPRIRSSRLISYTAPHRDGIESLFNADRSQGQQTIRGRYSGKELKPEQLLDILDTQPQPQSPSPADVHSVRRAKPASAPAHRNHGRDHAHAPRQRTRQPHQPGKSASRGDDTALKELFRVFFDSLSNRDPAHAWQAIQSISEYCSRNPNATLKPGLDNELLRTRIARFGYAVTRHWVQALSEADSTKAPPCTPSQLLRALRPFRMQKEWLHRSSLWQLASCVFEAKLESAQLAAGIEELVEMWRLSMADRLAPHFQEQSEARTPAFSVDDRTDWAFLPSRTIFASLPHEKRSHGMFGDMLCMLVPVKTEKGQAEPPHRRRNDFVSPALLTLDLLRECDPRTALAQKPQISPFVELLEAMLKTAPAPYVPFRILEKVVGATDVGLRDRYKAVCQRLNLDESRLPSVLPADNQPGSTEKQPSTELQIGNEESARENSTVTSSTNPNEATDPVQRFTLKNKSRLGRAVEQRDMTLVEKIHKEIFAFAATREQRLPLEIFEHLMQAYMQLRRNKVAVEIWHHILRVGYEPTVKTYTVMMRGAQLTRDVSGLEAMWMNMRTRGLQPDNHAWSVRIHGLLRRRDSVPQGLQALREMGVDWLRAAQRHSPDSAPQELVRKFHGAVDGVPRPDLVVMNSAVSGLALGDSSQIGTVLSWARSFGIEPDLITYNALLNMAMRHGKADGALKILQQMQTRGIEADSVTWTVLLTALFEGGFLDNLDHVQQQTKIIGFIDALNNKESGLPGLDEKGYAIIIDRLLKSYSNPTAATAVLSHMIRSGREPNTHIYTILMTSYFQRQPQPDLSAIEILWRQIQSRSNGWGAPLDTVFYDRMIEGYASVHRAAGIQPALEFLQRQRQNGQRPGWKALSAVARALAERGEMTRLQTLVDDVRASLRDSRGATQHTGQRDFWELIIQTGLLKNEGITRPEQLLPAEARMSPLVSARAG